MVISCKCGLLPNIYWDVEPMWGLCARVVLAGGCCGQLLSGLEERRGAVLAAALNHWLCIPHSCSRGVVLAAVGPELPGRQVLRARQGRQQAGGLLCSLCPGQSLGKDPAQEQDADAHPHQSSVFLCTGLPVGLGAGGRACSSAVSHFPVPYR